MIPTPRKFEQLRGPAGIGLSLSVVHQLPAEIANGVLATVAPREYLFSNASHKKALSVLIPVVLRVMMPVGLHGGDSIAGAQRTDGLIDDSSGMLG